MTTNYPSTKNITLTGFMGTGKSTVGALLAQRLGREFIDMDTQIESHFGKPIPQIFAEDGEPAFRVAEAQLCAQLAQRQNLVISSGGGALVNPQNRHALAQSGIVICLTATIDEILQRVAAMENRPLLNLSNEERRTRVRNLLYERRHAYAAIGHQADTTGRTPEEIVDDLLETLAGDCEVAGMTRIKVQSPTNDYHICIGEGLLAQTGTLLRNRNIRPGSAAIVTNAIIGAHYADVLLKSLREAGFEPTVCTVPEGEEHKTLATIATLYDQFIEAGMDRHSPAIALGGGVIGDMTGFAAASYLRGCPFVQIPTSLLAMVDASVGGKTGVDLPQGKNLVGAFKQPEVVIIDPDVFETLPPAEFRAGLAETIKHGIIDAPDLFDQIEAYGPTSLAHMVADAVRVKVRVVQEDPYEQGRRMVLNFGHTIGHAIEQASAYKLRHGEAVAIGMVAATRLSANLELCSPQLLQRIEKLLQRVDLPTRAGDYVSSSEIEQIMQYMAQDKKRAGKTLRFVIVREIGDVDIIDDPGAEIVQDAVQYVLA